MTTTNKEEVPKHRNALLDLYSTKEEIEERFLDPSKLTTKLKDRLPQPTGWRILVMPWSGPKKTKGGIILPDESHDQIAVATTTAYVVKTGPLAYADKEKFPTGPWCKEGDWVMFGRYAGSRFKIEDGELRILNDDEIIATILDPRDVKHAL